MERYAGLQFSWTFRQPEGHRQVPSLVSVSDLHQQTWRQHDRTEIFVSFLVSFLSFIIFHSLLLLPRSPLSIFFSSFSHFRPSLSTLLCSYTFYSTFSSSSISLTSFFLLPFPFSPNFSSSYIFSFPFSPFFFLNFPPLLASYLSQPLFLVSFAFLPFFLLLIISPFSFLLWPTWLRVQALEWPLHLSFRFRNKWTNPLHPSKNTQCNWACSLLMFTRHNFQALHFIPQS
jgi:hypothetical protein